MNKTNSQQGIAHILIILVLLTAGIGLGIYLVQNRTNILPFASDEVVGPETSFNLESNNTSVQVGEEFKVDVLVSSDFDAANTFSALISYPSDKLEVVGIEPPPGGASSSASLPSVTPEPPGKDNLISQILDQISSKVEAQTPMPTLSGASICIENTPRVALSWNSELNPDVLNWDIFREPPFAGSQQVYVGNYALPFNTPKVGRMEYPLLAQGDAGGTYAYYLEGTAGQSNKVTVTNNATCSNNSQLAEAAVPVQIQPGAQFNVKYIFKNIGTRVWPSSSFSFLYGPEVELKLISNSPFTPTSNELKKTSGGINLSVYPGQSYTFAFPVTAPATPGTYDFNWQMSAKGANFGQVSAKKIIVGTISSPSPSQTPNPPAACGLLCGSDSICAGAKDGCTSCLPADNGTQKVCKPAPSPSPNLTYFIKKWIEQTDDKQGKISLSGAVPNPGFETEPGQKGLMAKITFRAKANGEVNLGFIQDGTAIYRNSDNQNILSTTRGLKIQVGSIIGTPSPSPSASPVTLIKPVISRSFSGLNTTNCYQDKPFIDFYWSDVPGAEYYVIERLDKPGQEHGRVYHPVQSFVDTGLDRAKTYQYRVRSYASGVYSQYSDVFSLVTIPEGKACLSSSILTASPNRCENNRWQFSFSWESVPSATNYRLARTELGGGTTFQTLPGTFYVDSSYLINKEYLYSVKPDTSNLAFNTTTNVVKIKTDNCQSANTSSSPSFSPSPSPSLSSTIPGVKGKRADLFKDSKKPDFVNDQDISVFFSKCAQKGIELFGQPATVQPVCDIFEDSKITVSDWAVLIKFRNQSVAQ